MAAIKGAVGAQGRSQRADDEQGRLGATASQIGKGVRLVSSEPVKGDAGWEGTKAIFAFDDINKIQVSGARASSGQVRRENASAEPTNDDPVRFK